MKKLFVALALVASCSMGSAAFAEDHAPVRRLAAVIVTARPQAPGASILLPRSAVSSDHSQGELRWHPTAHIASTVHGGPF